MKQKKGNPVDQLASLLHEKWRKTRLDSETGTYEPRIKITCDTDWIKIHQTDQVDIANTLYIDLPKDWQEENKKSAEEALNLLSNILVLVHNNWLERNENMAAEEQLLRYSRLSKEDKKKDLMILKEAIRILEKGLL